MIPPTLMLAIRLAPILIRLIRLAEKYNENEDYEPTVEEQVIVNNLPKVERLIKEIEFDEIFADEHDDIGN